MKKIAILMALIAPPALAATTVTFNNTSYSIPASGELNWQALSSFLVDVGQHAQTTTFQKLGTRRATTTPVTVGSTDTLVITDLTVPGAVAVNLPAGSTGRTVVIVDGKGDAGTNAITIDGNGAETINGSLTLTLNHNHEGVVLTFQGTEWSVTSRYVTSLLNADISTSAAIAFSKLASLTSAHLLVGSAGNVATDTAITGDVTIGNTGVTAIASGVIINSDIAAAGTANIARNKLATDSALEVVFNDASGNLTSEPQLAVSRGGTHLASGTSGGILGYTGSTTLASSGVLAASGVVLGGGAGATPTSTSAGSADQVLRVPGAGGAPAFGQVDLSKAAAVTGTLGTANGGTGTNSAGTSGGVPYYNTTTSLASSALLTSGRMVVGGGAGSAPTTPASISTDQSITTTSTFNGVNDFNPRNELINSNFDFWQRGTSFASGAIAYTTDRWAFRRESSDTGGTLSQVASSPPTGSKYSVKVQRNSGNALTTRLGIVYGMEELDATRLAGHTITFSALILKGANYSPVSGAVNLTINTNTSANQAPNPFSGGTDLTTTDFVVTSSFVRYSVTGTVPSTAKYIKFIIASGTPSGTAGVNDFFQVAQVMVTEGSTPPAQFRTLGTYQQDFQAARAYYQKIAPSSSQQYIQWWGHAVSSTIARFFIPTSTAMRVNSAGTLTITNANYFGTATAAAALTISSPVQADVDFEPEGVYYEITAGSGTPFVANDLIRGQGDGGGPLSISADAEL